MAAAQHSPRVMIESAFSRFEKSVTPQDARSFHSTTLEDVWKAALEVEKEQRRRGSLRNMKRVEPFLKCLEIYAKSIDVLCNGTPFLPWIWAPVKLMIQLSSQFMSSFDKLMDAYVKIADALPRFDRYSKSIPQKDFHSILALVYADILEFHRRAYKFFRRRAWVLLFETGWKSFELRFENILKNLAYHRDLVDREATAFNIVEATANRRKVEEQIAIAEQEWESSHLQAVLAWLCVEDVLQENDLWRLTEKRLEGTCDWIFNISRYQAWLKNVDRSPLLWLTGIPGSGKSVFCAYIIQTIRKIEKTTTLFYYCLHKGDISDKPSIFLRTLVMQITRIYPEFAALIWDTYVQNAQLASNDNLQKLLPDLLSGAPHVRIIVDGIDEYDVKDCKLILDMLIKLQKKTPVGILISSRDEGLISAKMRNKPRISLSDEQHTLKKDMDIFVASRLDQAIEDYDLDLSDEMKEAGRDELLQKSGGMFLWVDLVIDGLQYVVSEDDFLRKIRELPEGLQAAYDRIVEKIMAIDDRRTRERMSRLLEWLVYSQTTLSADELISALAQGPSGLDLYPFNPASQRLLGFCKPLIDLSRTDSVDFVHFSAKEYFLDPSSKYHIDAIRAHLEVSAACLTYLNTTKILLQDDAVNERLSQIVKGHRAIHRYCVDHWHHHLSQGVNNGTWMKTPQGAYVRAKAEALRWIIKSTKSTEKALSDTSATKDLVMPYYDGLNGHVALLQVARTFSKGLVQADCEASSLEEYRAHRLIQDPTYLSQINEHYEADIKQLLSFDDQNLPIEIDKADLLVFRARHSTSAFRCRQRGCNQKNNLAFQTTDERDMHELSHMPRLQCPKSYCAWKGIGFSGKKELEAHMRLYHPEISGEPVPDVPQIGHPDASHISTPGGLADSSDSIAADSTVRVAGELTKLDVNALPHYLKKQHGDWRAIFNPQRQRDRDIGLFFEANYGDVIWGAASSRDGEYLAVAAGQTVEVLKVPSFQCKVRYAHSCTVRALCFSARGIPLATGAADGQIRMWIQHTTNAYVSETTFLKTSDARVLEGHRGIVRGLSFCGRGTYLVSGSEDRTVKVWRLDTAEALIQDFRTNDIVTDVACSPEGTVAAAASRDKNIYTWDIGTGDLLGCFTHHDTVYSVQFFSPPEEPIRLLSASFDGTVRVWGTANNNDTNREWDFLGGTCLQTLRGHTDRVLSATYSPDNDRIISCSEDGSIYFWDPFIGIPEMALFGHEGRVMKVVVGPRFLNEDGVQSLFATVGRDGKVRVWHTFPWLYPGLGNPSAANM